MGFGVQGSGFTVGSYDGTQTFQNPLIQIYTLVHIRGSTVRASLWYSFLEKPCSTLVERYWVAKCRRKPYSQRVEELQALSV